MNHNGYKSLMLITSLSLCLIACNSKKAEVEMDIPEEEESFIYVDTLSLHKSVFNKQLVCNGKLAAIQKSDLRMPLSGILRTVNVKEGQIVSKGTVLATIDDRDKALDLERAKREMERARVELQDKLIGLGYSGINDNIPTDLLHRAEVTSGYYSAKYSLESATKNLADCRLVAPFTGKVANVEGKPHQNADKLCTLIDDSYFDVEFKILEAELSTVKIGTEVKVSPFVDETVEVFGTVTEINPTVDEHGLIKINARVKNTSDLLVDGMNVRVIVENSVDGMYVVPKDAVVERDGYHVVFLYQDGKAVWTYVDILYSNLTSFAITGCEKKETHLNDGDIVITSGNLNLADDTTVKLKSPDFADE